MIYLNGKKVALTTVKKEIIFSENPEEAFAKDEVAMALHEKGFNQIFPGLNIREWATIIRNTNVGILPENPDPEPEPIPEDWNVDPTRDYFAYPEDMLSAYHFNYEVLESPYIYYEDGTFDNVFTQSIKDKLYDIPYVYIKCDDAWGVLTEDKTHYSRFDEMVGGRIEEVPNHELHPGLICMDESDGTKKEWIYNGHGWEFLGTCYYRVTELAIENGMTFPRKFMIKKSDFEANGQEIDIDIMGMEYIKVSYRWNEYQSLWERNFFYGMDQGEIYEDNGYIVFDAGEGEEYAVDRVHFMGPEYTLYAGGESVPVKLPKAKDYFAKYPTYDGVVYENCFADPIGKGIIYAVKEDGMTTFWKRDDNSAQVANRLNDVHEEDIYFIFDGSTWVDSNDAGRLINNILGVGIKDLYDENLNKINLYDYQANPGEVQLNHCRAIPVSDFLGKEYSSPIYFTNIYNIPPAIKTINKEVFRGIYTVPEIIIPDTVEYIQPNAICLGQGISLIKLPNRLSYIKNVFDAVRPGSSEGHPEYNYFFNQKYPNVSEVYNVLPVENGAFADWNYERRDYDWEPVDDFWGSMFPNATIHYYNESAE